jgi:hypothetical protein
MSENGWPVDDCPSPRDRVAVVCTDFDAPEPAEVERDEALAKVKELEARLAVIDARCAQCATTYAHENERLRSRVAEVEGERDEFRESSAAWCAQAKEAEAGAAVMREALEGTCEAIEGSFCCDSPVLSRGHAALLSDAGRPLLVEVAVLRQVVDTVPALISHVEAATEVLSENGDLDEEDERVARDEVDNARKALARLDAVRGRTK